MKKMTACILALSLATAIPVFSQNEPRQKTINVSGTAELEIVPDEIYVQVELREYDKKGGGKIDIDGIKSDFLKAVVATGIPDSNIGCGIVRRFGCY